MAKFAAGPYTVKNGAKYVGKGFPRYRSSWEWAFMNFCDSNENIQQWASEPVRIPYRNPLTGKMTMYVPDFIVTYRGPKETVRAELIEIKPKKQSLIESKVANARDRAVVAVNHAKWASAKAYCAYNKFTFRVITEDDLFYNGKRK